MAFDTTVVDRHLSNVTTHAGSTMRWRGNTYACLLSDLAGGMQLKEEGIFLTAQLSLLVRTALFSGDRPQNNDRIDVLIGSTWKHYRVAPQGITESWDGKSLVINMSALEQ